MPVPRPGARGPRVVAWRRPVALEPLPLAPFISVAQGSGVDISPIAVEFLLLRITVRRMTKREEQDSPMRIDQLTDEAVAAFIASHPGGATCLEIAQACGCSTQAVSQAEQDALSSLRRKFAARGLDAEALLPQLFYPDDIRIEDSYAAA